MTDACSTEAEGAQHHKQVKMKESGRGAPANKKGLCGQVGGCHTPSTHRTGVPLMTMSCSSAPHAKGMATV